MAQRKTHYHRQSPLHWDSNSARSGQSSRRNVCKPSLFCCRTEWSLWEFVVQFKMNCKDIPSPPSLSLSLSFSAYLSSFRLSHSIFFSLYHLFCTSPCLCFTLILLHLCLAGCLPGLSSALVSSNRLSWILISSWQSPFSARDTYLQDPPGLPWYSLNYYCITPLAQIFVSFFSH